MRTKEQQERREAELRQENTRLLAALRHVENQLSPCKLRETVTAALADDWELYRKLTGREI